ncbi:MAG: UvrD-helicase domain-containing protein [Gemmatimonadota bacterium]
MQDPPYLQGLNYEQKKAVLTTEGPLLVLAGAGSGKTRMLVHRIVHLIRGRQVEPRHILALTFTNKAADQMRDRVAAYAGSMARNATLSTFHSLGARILREHGARLGLPKRFAIYATSDQMGALRAATAEISISDDAFDLKRVVRTISDWKTRGVGPAEAGRQVAAKLESGTRADDYAVLAADAYGRYEEVLRVSGAVDFDDLLLLPVKLLEEHEEVRRAVWKRWHYVMIDEYQDTNAVQLTMARHLAGSRRNLCVVGDDDQSIYAFRGADVGNILDFEHHFPGAAVIKLEQNYRSTKRILEAANAVIAASGRRHAKRLRTENPIGEPIDACEHPDEAAEAASVAREIGVRRYARQLKWRDMAILYRTNPQGRALEEVLRENGVPYRMIGGQSFFDRREVADAVAYLRAVLNPDDEIAIRRIINWPTRGIGRTTVLKLAEVARARGVSFGRVLRNLPEDEIGSAQAGAIRGLLQQLAAARRTLHDAEALAAKPPARDARPPLSTWTADFFQHLRLEEAIRADPRNARTADMRVANVRDVAGTVARYERKVWQEREELEAEPDRDGPWAPPSLHDALARLALDNTEDEDRDEREAAEDRVTLMTLHSAKGLEFSDVFLIGLEEGLLPHARSLEDHESGRSAGALDEERRLLYVGITRAQRRLTLSYCRARRRGGESADVLPSRYLEDIPAELLNLKTSGEALPPEESEALRENFFAQMKSMLGPEEG